MSKKLKQRITALECRINQLDAEAIDSRRWVNQRESEISTKIKNFEIHIEAIEHALNQMRIDFGEHIEILAEELEVNLM